MTELAPAPSDDPPVIDITPVLTRTADLLQRSARGDAVAFAELFDAVGPNIVGLLELMLSEWDDVDEIAYQAVMAIWETSPSFDPDRESAEAWLFAIAHGAAVRALRSAGVRDPAARRRATRNTALDQTLDRLPPHLRLPLESAYFDAVPLSGVAAGLELTVSVASVRIRDGLIHLRDNEALRP